MFLLFAHDYDAEAKWLEKKLRDRGADARCIAPEALGIDYSATLTINVGVEATIRFEDGEAISSNESPTVINRLGFIEPAVWRHAEHTERTYAQSEINSFFAAFINAYSRVVNPVYNGCLHRGAAGHYAVFKALREQGFKISTALSERLTTENYSSDAQRILWWQGKVFATGSRIANEKQLRFLDPLATIEMTLIGDGDSEEIIHASHVPALSLYGDSLIDHIVSTTLQPA